ncbi:ABC transporter permease [Halobacterium salinarum]|uniref:ABC transporter permease n=1 Tax=Halobacterium TaxID=2239 RepID=UPI00196568C1|nr:MULTISPECIES: ABC transporter permease [Halobacterium]MCF2164539.1 ABC transporter permease [Halobacterium salinarum]MCF2167014.1 ABC transporter permease [Halobacterium salinarum]MCF2239687.1 ABC transporter permease [Halobacterium salinarum]MDL0138951.1 ABC transporter permease [Halobacterium salinarum]QRY22649.1 ABC transporter permease [Halobacterium sp. GSL-19]
MASKRFILKRLLLLVPVLFGVATFVFVILHLASGDPARVILGQRAPQQQVIQLRQELGLNDPVYVQYARFLVDAAQFDFGQSYSVAQGTAVRSVLADKIPVTLELALYGQAIGILLGIPLGVISAVEQDTLTDHFGRIGALSGISVPIYWSGPLLILAFSTFLGVFPASGRIESTIFLADSWSLFGVTLPLTGMLTVDTLLLGNVSAWVSAVMHLVLPAATIGIYSMALISRMMRSSMLEVVRQDYMRTARAKGQGSKITIMKHGFRNALVPVITVIGIQFGSLLGGAVLTETVFGIEGIGTILVSAINANDYPLVQGTVLTFALLFTLVNLLVDVTYSYLDPRIQQ